jgi:hypothetical protein
MTSHKVPRYTPPWRTMVLLLVMEARDTHSTTILLLASNSNFVVVGAFLHDIDKEVVVPHPRGGVAGLDPQYNLRKELSLLDMGTSSLSG